MALFKNTNRPVNYFVGRFVYTERVATGILLYRVVPSIPDFSSAKKEKNSGATKQ